MSWLRHRTKAAEGPLALTARQVGSAAPERPLGESLEEVLRHTCVTLLLTKNVNSKFVSEMLGHSNIALTLDSFGKHVLSNMQESAAAMEEVLS